MFLTKLTMDLSKPQVARDLADRDQLHRKMLLLFPDFPGGATNARERLGVLFRVEAPVILMQSKVAPVDTRIPEGYKIVLTKEISRKYAGAAPGSRYRFRLDANASHRDEHHRRVGCDTDLEAEHWVRRRADLAGFKVVDLDLTTLAPVRARRGLFHAVRYEGVLEVSQADLFHKALSEGIGQGKVYGFGLLSIG